ncbi:MAG: hypothetical protein WEA29_06960 [Acidimicrobiia bacterium]
MSVSRGDLEAKLEEIRGAVEETAEGARNAGILIAMGVVALVLIAFLNGRRRGRKGVARVEVYRLR